MSIGFLQIFRTAIARSPSIADRAEGYSNNFNIIRLVAAFLVLFSHAFALSTGRAEEEPLRNLLHMTLAQIAVDIFFISSGFLIVKSLTRSQRLSSYVRARCLRILPALWASLLLTVIISGLFFTELSVGEFFSKPAVYGYLARNAVLATGIEHRLLDVFATAPFSGLMNASLWTLPYEVAMYISLALLWLVTLRLGSRFKVSFPIVVLSAALFFLFAHLLILERSPSNLVRLTAFFFSGSALYLYRSYVKLNGLVVCGLVLVWVLTLGYPSLSTRFYVLAITYVTLYCALTPSGWLLGFNKLGDYSYGVYIYAWPVQQMLVTSYKGIQPFEMVLWSSGITFVLAALSWHCIEKTALARKIK